MKIEPLDLSEARHEALKLRPKASATEAGRMTRATMDWMFRILSSNQVVGLDQEQIVSRSRELALDDTTMAKFLAAVWKNVFGPDGIRLQAKVPMQRGGKPNLVINRILEGAWAEWGKKTNCTLDGRLSWIQLQRVISRTVATDGECFLHMVRPPGHPFGFSLEIISSDRVERLYGRNAPLVLPNGNRIFMGVESEYGTARPVAYYIFTGHPNEVGSGPRQRIRVPAEEIIHIFLPVFDNQWRGLPWATPAMFRMNMLKGYLNAEVVASRVAACQMGIITKNVDPDAGYGGEQPHIDSLGGEDFPVEAGAFMSLQPGEALSQFKPEHPTTAFDSFVKGAKLDIACGLDLSYMNLSGDVGSANYSSARVGLLDERDTWEGLQGFYIEELCQPIFTAWLEMAFLTFLRNALPGGDWRAYNQTEWHPRSFPWIDPLKDANAEIEKLKHGMTTLTRILGSQGYSFEETMQERKDELDYLKANGMEELAVAYAPPPVKTDTVPGGNPDTRDVVSGGGGATGRLLTNFVMLADKGAKGKQ